MTCLRMTMLAAPALLLSMTALGLAADERYDRGKVEWLGQRYVPAVDLLLDYRRSPYGRTPEVDYMLGTSGCRLTGREVWGHGVLTFVLNRYPLTAESRSLVIAERDGCVSGTETPDPTQIKQFVVAGVSARAKTFYWLDSDVGIASYPMRTLRDVPREDLVARLFPREQPSTEVPADFMGTPAITTDRFRIVSRGGQSSEDIAELDDLLTEYMLFLESFLDVRLPEDRVTILLVPTVEDLRQAASDLHGLDVSPSTIGYSFRDDMTVIAVIPGRAYGTLLHELFHLLVRANFGDVPLWLDEGIASLYEVSVRDETGGFRGVPNWRGPVLERLGDKRPSLETLITSDWSTLSDSGPSPDIDQISPDFAEAQAAFLATARYFVLYLQDRGSLADIYLGLRDVDIETIDDDASRLGINLVQQAARMPIGDVQSDFDDWLIRAQAPDYIPEETSKWTPDQMLQRWTPTK